MVSVQFVVVSPANHIAIMPLACADLNAERQPIVVETCGNADGRHLLRSYVQESTGDLRGLQKTNCRVTWNSILSLALPLATPERPAGTRFAILKAADALKSRFSGRNTMMHSVLRALQF